MSQKEVSSRNYMRLGWIYQILRTKNIHVKNLETSILQTIIDDGFDVNYKLQANTFICKKIPEYVDNTILHLFIEYYSESLDPCFNFLIKCGADLTSKNDKGFTPLLLAFKYGKRSAVNLLLHSQFDMGNSTNSHCKNGMSHFHVACSTNQVQIVDFFLKAGILINEQVNNDSPNFPGYTPLHFAMENLQLQTVRLLLKHGASLTSKNTQRMTPLNLVIKKLMLEDSENNSHVKIKQIINDVMIQDPSMCQDYTPLHFDLLFNFSIDCIISHLKDNEDYLLIKDVNGITPFDLCLEKLNLCGIISILSAVKQHHISKLKFTDSTNLLNFLQAMKKQNEFEKFLTHNVKNVNTFIPFDSPILAGSNLLHLSVIFDGFVNCILSCNVDFRMLNANGISPLHLAFRLKKVDTVAKILNFHEKIPLNCIDRDNLSSLHIACVMRNHKLVELLLRNGSDPNLPTLCDFQWNTDVKNISSLKTIRKGSTPLHVAVRMMECELAIMLLCFGSKSYMPDADGITPFDIILNYYDPPSYEQNNFNLLMNQLSPVLDKMLENNIKALMVSDACLKIFYKALSCNNGLWRDELKKVVLQLYQAKPHRKLGFTKLQLACVIGDYSVIKEELKRGAKVNKQVNIQSPLWPGNTALHILIIKNQWSVEIAQMLLKYGADPNIKNVNNQTPFHLVNNGDLRTALSLVNDKFTNVNPVNNEGLSHFHLSCKAQNLPLIKKFLKLGVNVDASVDYFADQYAGYTPFHFTVEYIPSTKDIIELLISQGADPNIKDGNGFTILHLTVKYRFFQNVLISLLRYPKVDVQIPNIFGELAFELYHNRIIYCFEYESLFKNVVNLFLKKGANLSFKKLTAKISENSRSLIAKATSNLSKETFELLIATVPDLTDTDNLGQNAIHYLLTARIDYPISSHDFCQNIEILIKKGCEINHKDIDGKTVLHKAFAKTNCLMVEYLLQSGADIYIKDDIGNETYKYIGSKRDQTAFMITNHRKQLQGVGIHVDKCYKLKEKYANYKFMEIILEEKVRFQHKLEKLLKSSFSVDYFLSKKFIVDYRRMPAFQRQIICDVCESTSICSEFFKLSPFIKLQFRKARARMRLLEPASVVFHELIDMILPEPCLESIFQYLKNDDLMNMVRVNGNLEFSPLPENC